MENPRLLVQRLLFLTSVLLLSTVSCSEDDEITKYPLLMPDIHVHMDESYICTPVKMDPTKKRFIVGFEPNATMARAHHVMIYGCTTPGSELPQWNCGHQKKVPGLEKNIICGSGIQVVYVWARDAPKLVLPEGVGFEVGGDAEIQYLILQVHYSHKIPEGARDNSGVILHYTDRQVSKLAGVLTLTSGGALEPHAVTNWETACRITEHKTVHPFAYRVHTHGLGLVVAGYRVRRDSAGVDQWTLLGRRDPQLPQLFSPVLNTDPVVFGDQLAGRCTMNNTRDEIVWAGRTNRDEMCMFYIMYWVEGNGLLDKKNCVTKGSPRYSWEISGDFNNIPDRDASLLAK